MQQPFFYSDEVEFGPESLVAIYDEQTNVERALVTLRAAHETLLRERQRLERELADMQERHEAVMRERHRAGEELEAILRRFRASV